MKKQHPIKNQRCGNSQNLIFYRMLFFFRKRRVKVWVCTGNRMAVATTGDRRRC